MMNSADVLKLYDELSRIDVAIWVDGGWGVDALLGKQTRPHKDLDIAIQQIRTATAFTAHRKTA